MGFNYGLEKKNFDSQWAVTRKQYEDAGMSNEAIQAMYDYDWSVFNANRSYQNHTQEMAARMGVSWSAIRIRLQQMQVIKGKPIHCHPLDIIRFGE